ncbi:MAG: aldo/keto reductase [Sphaerochaetaceae bacterium]|jgi:aryl-alcohol dehydrogenase-like predicted oxidoreductase|nr:aldo/keto reductase [Sphaerochaetaceae bacterium]MDD3163122.1 aldo/keto reductase [Sphaerochaetaceae bacterium]MDD4006656.1 aldo/keto reductase [Sphaerochaetaceae bacterium]MDD4396220.1 aldo/keto reductase [Sphaerochaetaceae bacterium]
MRKRKIISSLPDFSCIAMGTDHMGQSKYITRALAFEELETYVKHGGNVLDTARSYSLEDGVSKSEDIVGAFVRSSCIRSSIIVMTKGGRENTPRSTFLQRIKEDFERSADQLGFIPDIWFLHRDCPWLPVEEIIGFCGTFLQGALLGLSNWRPRRFSEALACTPAPVISEIQFSLAPSTPAMQGDRSLVCMNPENRRFYSDTQIPVLAFSSQAKGYYSKLISGQPLTKKARDRYDSALARSIGDRVKILGEELGASPAALSVAYIASQHAFPAIPIVGSSHMDQLEDSLSGADIELTSEQLCFLDRGPLTFR